MEKISDSFFRQLKFARWSRFLSFVFAFITTVILSVYFIFIQANHRQVEWYTKHMTIIPTQSVELEPKRIYKISWDDPYATPTEVHVNRWKFHPANVRRFSYYTRKYNTDDTFLTNPMIVRFNRKVDFALEFRVRTPTNVDSWGEFWRNWFKSISDILNIVNWKVEDITDIYKNEKLLVDGVFPIMNY